MSHDDGDVGGLIRGKNGDGAEGIDSSLDQQDDDVHEGEEEAEHECICLPDERGQSCTTKSGCTCVSSFGKCFNAAKLELRSIPPIVPSTH